MEFMPNIFTPSPAEWDHFVRQQRRAHFLQLSGWGTLKAAYGWQVERIALAHGDQITAGAQLLFRRLPLRLGNMAYLAMGPYFNTDEGQHTLWSHIDQCARKHQAPFLKWEPGIFLDGQSPPDFEQLRFTRSPQTIQPPRTVLLNIGDDNETIMARMNQGTRRKIRQSLKNGIHYDEATRDDMAKFNTLMHTTGQRNEFGVHEPSYYERMYDLFVPAGDAALFLAEHEGDSLAGIFVFAVGDTAWYLAGASSNHKRNLMASYGIQWHAIQWAKARGCHYYDMWGIPDEDETTLEAQFQERSDGLWGVYGFKRGWGGAVIRSAGAWDRVYNPLVYGAYRLSLRLRGDDE